VRFLKGFYSNKGEYPGLDRQRKRCHRAIRQAGALLGLITIFNFGIIQRVKAVDLRIKLASESSFPDYTSFVSISHISEKKEQRGARPNIFLAGVHGGIYKAGLCGERGAALEPKCVTNSAPDGILREWAPALLMGSHENCISFDQNCSAATNIQDSESHRDWATRGKQKNSLHFAHYNGARLL